MFKNSISFVLVSTVFLSLNPTVRASAGGLSIEELRQLCRSYRPDIQIREFKMREFAMSRSHPELWSAPGLNTYAQPTETLNQMGIIDPCLTNFT